MTITDSAKEILLEMLKQENKKGFTATIVGAHCHSQLVLDFTDEIGELINGVSFIIDPAAAEALKAITLDGKEGQLTFRMEGGCAGCNGGCNQ